MAMARSAENCTGAQPGGAQRSNRIIDLARRDAAPGGNLSVWSRSLTHCRSARSSVIEARRLQRSFGDGLIAVEIKDLQESWMQHADVVLQDDAIIAAVHQALAHRHPNSRSHGRPGFPAEVVLRLLILKHVRNGSYAVLEREVRANLVYRDFTRVGAEKQSDARVPPPASCKPAFLVRSASLLSRPDLALPKPRGAAEGIGRSGATRSHAQRALAREHGEDGEHRTFPEVSTVAHSRRSRIGRQRIHCEA